MLTHNIPRVCFNSVMFRAYVPVWMAVFSTQNRMTLTTFPLYSLGLVFGISWFAFQIDISAAKVWLVFRMLALASFAEYASVGIREISRFRCEVMNVVKCATVDCSVWHPLQISLGFALLVSSQICGAICASLFAFSVISNTKSPAESRYSSQYW